MLLEGVVFLFYFFPIVLCGYYILGFSRGLQNLWLFLASLVFYAWGEPAFLPVIVFLILWSWLLGLILGNNYLGNNDKNHPTRAGELSIKAGEPSTEACDPSTKAGEHQAQAAIPHRKAVLAIAIAVDLLILGYFKYTGFAAGWLHSLSSWEIFRLPEIALPIGISFYTLSAISYMVDVYRDGSAVEKNLISAGLYIAFFPRLTAGPVAMYHSVREQLKNRRHSPGKFGEGLARLITGLAKKVLLANNLAIVADLVFNWSELGRGYTNVPALMAWMGLIAYTLQLYFELSGYSDMAIGLGLIFGFETGENFRHPYTAISVTDFWNRWHISLISFFREYVYIPLGGSRTKNSDLMVRNMLIMWVLIGVWHGAGWMFLFWALWHFAFLLAERLLEIRLPKLHIIPMRIYTLLVVMVGWVLFRTKDIYQAYMYFRNLLCLNQNGFLDDRTLFLLKEYIVFFVAGVILCGPIPESLKTRLAHHSLKPDAPLRAADGPGSPGSSAPLCPDGDKIKPRFPAPIRAAALLLTLIISAGYIFTSEGELPFYLHKYSDSMTELHGGVQRLLGKREFNSFALIKGVDGMIYYGSTYRDSSEDLEKYADRLLRLRKYVEKTGARFIVILPPAKILPGVSKVNRNLMLNDPNARLDKFLMQLQQREVYAIDLRNKLKATGEPLQNLFFKTDHRWTGKACFYAMEEIVDRLEARYGEALDPDHYYRDPDNYTEEVYGGLMLGSQGRRTGTIYGGVDDIGVLHLRDEDDTDFSFIVNDEALQDNSEENRGASDTRTEDGTVPAADNIALDKDTATYRRGPMEESLIFRENLSAGDLYGDSPFDVYLGEMAGSETIINHKGEGKPKLAVIRDSYFSPVALYLAPMFSEIDLCYNQDKRESRKLLDGIEDGDYSYVFYEVYPYGINRESFSFLDK